jgi:predicted nucleic acid-binding protein
MTVAIDTNILLDILLPDPVYKDSSLSLIRKYMKSNSIIISDIVYGELASQFKKEELLVDFFNDASISLVGSTPKSLWISAKA